MLSYHFVTYWGVPLWVHAHRSVSSMSILSHALGSRYLMVTWVLIADLIIPSLVSLVGESPHSCWFRSIGVVWSYIGQYFDWNIPKASWTKAICLDSYLSPPPSLQDPLVCWWFQCFEFLPIWDDNPTWLCLRKRKIRNHTCPTSIYKWP